MEAETGTATPNSKEEDPETETDGKEGAAIQDQNPKKDTEIMETTAEIGTGVVVETGEIKLHGDIKEKTKIEKTEIEIEKEERTEMEEKERAQIEKMGTEAEKEEKMKK